MEKAHPRPQNFGKCHILSCPIGWWGVQGVWAQHKGHVSMCTQEVSSCAKRTHLGQEILGGREKSPSHREPIFSFPY